MKQFMLKFKTVNCVGHNLNRKITSLFIPFMHLNVYLLIINRTILVYK